MSQFDCEDTRGRLIETDDAKEKTVGPLQKRTTKAPDIETSVPMTFA